MQKEGPDTKFIFVGNHRCLDFINTHIAEKAHPVDLLQDFSDLVSWLEKAQFLDATQAGESLSKWNGKSEGKEVLDRALVFRAVLRDMVERIAKGKPVQETTIDEINGLLRNLIGYRQLAKAKGTFESRFHVESSEAIHIVVPIAESASDLLCHSDFSLIKRCENPACVLYFYDISKNHARRWCSMNICGNRMKVAAHYRRRRIGK